MQPLIARLDALLTDAAFRQLDLTDRREVGADLT